MGGGGFSMEPENTLLDDFVLGLAGRSGRERPRICFLPTASGDAHGYIADFERRRSRRGRRRASSRLFARTVADLRAFCSTRTRSTSAAATPPTCSRSGGSTASIASSASRMGGRCRPRRDVGRRRSAGSRRCTTDSFGPELRPLRRRARRCWTGSLSPHYGGEAQRRPLFQRLVADGTLPPGYGSTTAPRSSSDDRELVEVVASSPRRDGLPGRALDGGRGAVETQLASRYLG